MDSFAPALSRFARTAESMSSSIASMVLTSPGDSPMTRNVSRLSDNKLIQELRGALDGPLKQKLEALKTILMSRGRDLSSLFADVIKQVQTTSVEAKKLVYIYLLRYADDNKDIALLSVNTFQKDLSGGNELIRGMALRVLSSLNIPDILPVLMLSVKKGVQDQSPYVRKIAAQAICKVHSMDPVMTRDYFVDLVQSLLEDNSVLVAGSACLAFNYVCSDEYDLVHKHYRKLCRMLVDSDDWSQLAMLQLLASYARSQLSKPQEMSLDKDLELLLDCCLPLFHNRNAAVAVEVASLFYHLAPETQWRRFVPALIRLLRSRKEIEFFTLCVISSLLPKADALFAEHYEAFFIRDKDPEYVTELKFKILAQIANGNNLKAILHEFEFYVQNPDVKLVQRTISTLGQCARTPEAVDSVLNGLLMFLSCTDESIQSECAIVISQLILKQPDAHLKIIKRLALNVNKLPHSLAKGNIYWLVGFTCDMIPDIAKDVTRLAVKNFTAEDTLVKLQTLTLAFRVALRCSDERIVAMLRYLLRLAFSDANYVVRDKARIMFTISQYQVKVTKNQFDTDPFFVKPIPEIPSALLEKLLFGFEKNMFFRKKPVTNKEEFTLSSLSHLLGRQLKGYRPLPEWPTEPVSPSQTKLRDVEFDIAKWNPWLVPTTNPVMAPFVPQTQLPSVSFMPRSEPVDEKGELDAFLDN